MYFAHTNVVFEVAGIYSLFLFFFSPLEVHLVIVSQVRVPWCTLVLLFPDRHTHFVFSE